MEEKVKPKPNLSILALASFIASFIIARTFTSLYPKIVWEVSGYHVHRARARENILLQFYSVAEA